MRRRLVPIAGLFAALLIAVAGFVALSERVFPFTEPLQRQDSLQEDVDPSRSTINMQFANDGERVTLASEVMVTEFDSGRYHVSVRSSHTDGAETHLDGLRLRLDPGQQAMPEVALQTPGGNPWNPIRFSRTDDGQAVSLEAPDLGVQGRGTVTLDFLIGPYDAGDAPESIWLGYNARLHEEGTINLTDYQAEALIEIPMPAGDEPAFDGPSPAS